MQQLDHEQLMEAVLVTDHSDNLVFLMSKTAIMSGVEPGELPVAFVRGGIHPQLFNVFHASTILYHAHANTVLGLNRALEMIDKGESRVELRDVLERIQNACLLAQQAATIGVNVTGVEQERETRLKEDR